MPVPPRGSSSNMKSDEKDEEGEQRPEQAEQLAAHAEAEPKLSQVT